MYSPHRQINLSLYTPRQITQYTHSSTCDRSSRGHPELVLSGAAISSGLKQPGIEGTDVFLLHELLHKLCIALSTVLRVVGRDALGVYVGGGGRWKHKVAHLVRH